MGKIIKIKRNSSSKLLIIIITTATTIILTRFFLALFNYPQLGGDGLHIAHVLWGGLLMFFSYCLAMIFKLPKKYFYILPAFFGVGWGLFIDEIGKFLTKDNNYFFKPALPAIYIILIIMFLFYILLSKYDKSAFDPLKIKLFAKVITSRTLKIIVILYLLLQLLVGLILVPFVLLLGIASRELILILVFLVQLIISSFILIAYFQKTNVGAFFTISKYAIVFKIIIFGIFDIYQGQDTEIITILFEILLLLILIFGNKKLKYLN